MHTHGNTAGGEEHGQKTIKTLSTTLTDRAIDVKLVDVGAAADQAGEFMCIDEAHTHTVCAVRGAAHTKHKRVQVGELLAGRKHAPGDTTR